MFSHAYRGDTEQLARDFDAAESPASLMAVEEPALSASTILHRACAGGKVAAVNLILERTQCSPNDAIDAFGKLPQHVAAQYGHVEVLKTLVEGASSSSSASAAAAADLFVHDRLGRLPLHAADTLDVVEYLMEKGVPVDIRECYTGRTLLHFVAERGNERLYASLLDRFETLRSIALRDSFGRTPVMLAGRAGMLTMVKFLVETQDMRVAAADRDGRTLAHYAAEAGHIAILQWLQQLDASSSTSPLLTTRDTGGKTILHVAAGAGRSSTVRWILENTSLTMTTVCRTGVTPLHTAAENGHWHILTAKFVPSEQLLLVRDANKRTLAHALAWRGHLLAVEALARLHEPLFHDCDASLKLPLHYACETGHTAIVCMLLDRGYGNVESVDILARTPLILAVNGGHTETVEVLATEYGASLTGALHAACETGSLFMCEFLVDTLGVALDESVASKGRPVQVAARHARLHVISWLVERGVNLMQPDEDKGEVALFSAAEPHVLDHLLKLCPALLQARDAAGRSALYGTVTRDAVESVRVLHERGLDLFQTDNDGSSLWLVAATAGANRTLAYLFEQHATKMQTEEESAVDVESLRDTNTRRSLVTIAAMHGHLETCELLVQHGARVVDSPVDRFQRNALHWSAFIGSVGGALWLLKRDPQLLRMRDMSGRTPVMIAIETAQIGVLKAMLEYDLTQALDAGASRSVDLSNALCVTLERASPQRIAMLRMCLSLGAAVTQPLLDCAQEHDPVALDLLRAAQRGWRHDTHTLFPCALRRAVVIVRLVRDRLWRDHRQRRPGALPFLPAEIWEMICGFFYRDDFTIVKSQANNSNSKSNGSVEN